MKIGNLNSISLKDLIDLGNLQKEKITLICNPEYSDQYSYINICPVLILKDDTFFRIKEDQKTIMYGTNFREDYEDKHELLTQRVLENELFKVVSIISNQREDIGIPFFSYGNNILKLDHEIHEIYSGIFDLNNNDFFIPSQTEILNLLIKKNERGQSNYFYVDANNEIYGSFNFNGTDGKKIKLKAIHNTDGYIHRWDIQKCENLFVEFESETRDKVIIKRKLVANWLPENLGEKIKFLSNDELLNFVIKNTKALQQFSKNEINTFKKIHNIFSTPEFSDIDKSIYHRAQNLFSKSKNNEDLLESFLKFLPETGKIQDQIVDLKTEKNEVYDKLSSLKIEKQEIEKNIKELDAEKKEIQHKVEKIKDQCKKLEGQEFEKAKESNEELKKLLEENRLLDEKFRTIEKYKDVQNLDNDIHEKEINIKFLQKKEDELKDSMVYLRQEFIGTQKEANEKLKELIKAKTHFDFISGREFGTELDNDDQITIEKDPSSYFDKGSIGPDGTSYISPERMFLDEVNKKMKEADRNFSISFLANILISIHQNTFTIFSGVPGSGKTSLAKLITHILVKNPIKRVEIPVAKGWTSQKDFIGFYNPLTKSFSATDPKMYKLLKLLNMETNEKFFLDSPMGYVILDEANLSPIEHYWSSFYNLTDSSANENNLLTINLGTDQLINFANNLRFIGTINSDQTTEELSPRIIDRVNIIRISNSFEHFPTVNNTLNPSAINEIGLTFKDAIRMFSLKDFNENFQKNWEDSLQKESFKELFNIYKKLKSNFKKLNLNISQRIDIAFATYSTAAINFMPPYRALDYFISQRILPKIEGHGNLYCEHLKEFKDEIFMIFKDQRIDDSESCDILQKIIDVGSNDGIYDNYNYFLIN